MAPTRSTTPAHGSSPGTCVIFNPSARGEKARRFLEFLEDVAGDVELKPTTGPGAATALARTAVEQGYGRIIAAGGDGTVFEVLNGLAGAPGGLEHAALGVLPLGTANVFAHELGMPVDPRHAWEALKAATVQAIDCGRAEFRDAQGGVRREFFAIVAGAGLDARAVELVDWSWKKRVGKLAYIAAALRALYRYPDMVRCHADSELFFEGRVVLVGNGRQYAGKFPIFRDGALNSGRLHLCGIRRVTLRILLGCLRAYVTGRWGLERECHLRAVSEVRLESDRPVPLQLDGEFAGWLPATLGVMPGALKVLMPPA